MTTFTVGPSETLTTPTAGMLAILHAIFTGDTSDMTLYIKLGTYTGDNALIGVPSTVFTTPTSTPITNLTITGEIGTGNARPVLQYTAGANFRTPSNGLALYGANNPWTGLSSKGQVVNQSQNLTIENLEIKENASANDAGGIRHQGTDITIRNCLIHHCKNGIKSSDNYSDDILIEDCTLHTNGHGDGLTHNIYLGLAGNIVIRGCNSYNARVGHCYKVRGGTTLIENCLGHDDDEGTASTIIDINGGHATVTGCTLQKGLLASNPNQVILYWNYQNPAAPPDGVYRMTLDNNLMTCLRTNNGAFLRAVVGSSPFVYSVTNNDCYRHATSPTNFGVLPFHQDGVPMVLGAGNTMNSGPPPTPEPPYFTKWVGRKGATR